ncbi:MAG: hypothetical protein ACOX7U_03190 [Desulfitobacteriia bacterium]|jgi:hypothetical protein
MCEFIEGLTFAKMELFCVLTLNKTGIDEQRSGEMMRLSVFCGLQYAREENRQWRIVECFQACQSSKSNWQNNN